MIADLRLAPELERSQFGERDREPHRYLYLPGLASVAQDGDERRVLAHVVSPHQRHDVAGAIGSDDAAVEREGDGAIGDDGEWMIEPCGGAFVRSATEDADGRYRLAGSRRAQADVIRAAAPRFHQRHRRPDASAQPRVRSCADRDGRFEILRRQDHRRLAEPSGQRQDDPVPGNGRREEAAVEQHEIRPDHCAATDRHDLRMAVIVSDVTGSRT